MNSSLGAVLALENGGYIYGSYAITIAVIGAFTWRVLRRSRQLADRVDDADKYWT